jgi:hypothetical protein
MDDLFIDRRGMSEDAYMKTNTMIALFTEQNQLVAFKDGYLQVEPTRQRPQYRRKWALPAQVQIAGIWLKTAMKNRNNILGTNDVFLTRMHEITIPVEETRDEYVGYYGARIIRDRDIFNLKNPSPMPLFDMTIGKDYVQHYIGLSENGYYVEKHNTPHFHQPKLPTANGYLILGEHRDGNLYLTRFKIPYGCAIYTPPHVLHSDAELVGDYYVMYTQANNYSTLILKNEEGNCIIQSSSVLKN